MGEMTPFKIGTRPAKVAHCVWMVEVLTKLLDFPLFSRTMFDTRITIGKSPSKGLNK